MKTKIATLFAFILITTAAISAQVTGGMVTGTVLDENSAVVPGADIKLTDKARGNTLTTQTTDSGSYNFPNVNVGEYKITIEKSGFALLSKELTISLNQTTTIDAILQVGATGAVVDVTSASETVVQTDSSQLGKSFNTRSVQDLPIANNPNNLATLAPNALPQASGTLGSGASIGGTRPRGNSFNTDGVDNNDAGVTGPSTNVIQDAVQEFTLLQNNFNAEFGAGSGGQFNIITKSGTNEFHGSGFLYTNSQKFNAHQTLEDGGRKNYNKLARYGGTFGGPIIKNKLFFFGAYQRNFTEQAAASSSFFAPTARGLDQLAALPGVSPFVINLLRNNLQLATNANPNVSAQVGPILGVSGIEFGEVVLPIPQNNSAKAFQVNVDHLPNENNQFRYRFGFDRQRALQPGNGGLGFNNFNALDSRLFSMNWVRTISASLINDLRLSYRYAPQSSPLVDDSLTDFPNIRITSANILLGPNEVLPQGTPVDNNYQVYNAMTLIQGNHTIKFGGELRRLLYTSSFLPRSRGDYFYSSWDTLLQDLKPDEANIRGVGSPNFVGNRLQWFFFGQDDWKIRPNFTLNLGLRYEYTTLPRDAASQALNSLASVPGVIEFNRPETDKKNFAPRIGFAWSPTLDNSVGRLLFGKQGDSSIRANFAISHYVNFQNLLLLSVPPQFSVEFQNGGSDNRFLERGAVPNVVPPLTTPEQARAATSSFIPNQTVPYTTSWSVSYQRQIARDTGIEFRFLSTRGYKLPVQRQLNGGLVRAEDQIIPTLYIQPTAAQLSALLTLGSIIDNSPVAGRRALAEYGFQQAVTEFSQVGRSWYDGASVSLNRRFTQGLALSAAYTFSKTLDNATNELNSSAINPRRPQYGFNIADEKGLSALDVPHRFVASFNYDINFFDKLENPVWRMALSGWQLNGIFQIQSGQPITVLSGIDSNLNFDAAGDRSIFNPNGNSNLSSAVTPVAIINGQVVAVPMGDDRTVAYVANDPNAGYIQTGFLAKATAGRNTLRTRGFNQTDMVILKNTRFGSDGRFNFQIGAEFFDLFNQRQKSVITSLNNGIATTPAFATAGNPNFLNYEIGNFSGRTITMRAKFIF